MITKIKGSSLLRTKHTHSLFGFLNSLNDDENITGKHTELSLLTVSHPLTCPAVSASGGIRLHFEHEFLSFFLSGASHFLHCIHSEGKKRPHKCHFIFQAICYRQLHHYFVQINLHKSLLECFILATLFGSQSTN